MKKCFLIASIVLAPFFTSCEGDDSSASDEITNTPEDGDSGDSDEGTGTTEDGGDNGDSDEGTGTTGDDDDNGDSGEVTNPFEADLIGTWELVSYTSNNISFFDCGDVEIYDGSNRQYNEVWGDNCENTSVGENNESYTIEDDVLIVNVPAELGSDGEVFNEAFTEVYDIILLDESNLTLEQNYIEDDVTFVDIHKYIRK